MIGGGPAGLQAAEVAASAGMEVTVYDQKPSVGRKFLVAGRGGLNLTHSEPITRFVERYRGGNAWPSILRDFSPDHLRAWAHGLGVTTFVGTSGRVFPENKQSAALLRRWVQRLRGLGVQFEMQTRWCGWDPDGALQMCIHGSLLRRRPDATLLAMGGGSWPQTGSDGLWVQWLRAEGIEVAGFQPANCGWEVNWPQGFPGTMEGCPLKNIAARALDDWHMGEIMITRYGVEGGLVYRLGPELRDMPTPTLQIDFKPGWDAQRLQARWALSATAQELLKAFCNQPSAALAKCFSLALARPRPLTEAISTAGGVLWEEVTDDLMLRKKPGVFVAGEMLDWEAPTGGYLLQGCFATGHRAGQAVVRYAMV